MIYKRHYIQFNDFVFDEYEMIDESDTSTSFKMSSSEYGFIHGDYVNAKGSGIVKSGSVALTVTLNMKKLPCDMRPFYKRLFLSQISKPGKLWAVQDNSLVWAYAMISSYNELLKSRKNTVSFDVDFYLPEGVWHKADKQRTFLVPFDVCDFMDCYGFKEVNPCDALDCCDCEPVLDASDCCECDCSEVEEDNALCFFKDFQSFYSCFNKYRIIYDCVAAEKFFSDGFVGRKYIGSKAAGSCGVISAKYYSNTDIDTTDVSFRIHADMKNPYIEVNGNANIIKGEYNGVLIINSDGSVYYGEFGCDACDPLDVSKWVIPDGMDYGWTIHPGNNRINIQTNTCCGNPVAYIDVGELTY